MSLAPFEQLRFEDVPEAPRLPHDDARAERRTIPIVWPAGATTDVHVRVLGAGPPLLLVHGFMTTGYSWRYVIAELAKTWTVYAPDLPGAGRSGKPDTSYAPAHLAEAIGAIVAALGIRGAPVVGNSLGGWLCMHLALADAGAMGRLVNLHSPGLATARNHLLRGALTVVPAAERIVRHLVWRSPERWVHKNVHYVDDTLKSREEHREYAAPLATPEGAHAFYRMLKETFAPPTMRAFERRLKALGGRFPIPLQLVYAPKDPMVPPAIGRRFAALLPSAEYVTLAGGSHFAHVDAPALFLAAVRPFLALPVDVPRATGYHAGP